MDKWKTLKTIGMAVGLGFLLVMSTAPFSQEGGEKMMPPGASTNEIMGTLRGIRRPKPEGAPTALSVRVYFAYDSAELTPETKAELTNYGKSLTAAEFKEAHWAIEGHTDASGSVVYNEKLSERRARSVYNHLVREYGVNPDRFLPVGKGESDLFDPTNPLSGKNRRVRIRYLGG